MALAALTHFSLTHIAATLLTHSTAVVLTHSVTVFPCLRPFSLLLNMWFAFLIYFLFQTYDFCFLLQVISHT